MSEVSGRRIRQATVMDVDVIVRHRRSMFEDMGEGTKAQLDAMVKAARPFIAAGLRDGSYRAWLVEVGGHVVAGGGLAITPYQPTPLDPVARRVFILNMYTEPQYRRQGLAVEVLQAILAWCREQGLRAVQLHASEAGRALYEKVGFEHTNEMRLLVG